LQKVREFNLVHGSHLIETYLVESRHRNVEVEIESHQGETILLSAWTTSTTALSVSTQLSLALCFHSQLQYTPYTELYRRHLPS